MRCDACGKEAAEPRRDGEDADWVGLPDGWMARRVYVFSELSSEDTVCSSDCAAQFEAREREGRRRRSEEYEARKAAGQLSDYEILGEQWAETMVEQFRRAAGFFDGDKWLDPYGGEKAGTVPPLVSRLTTEDEEP